MRTFIKLVLCLFIILAAGCKKNSAQVKDLFLPEANLQPKSTSVRMAPQKGFSKAQLTDDLKNAYYQKSLNFNIAHDFCFRRAFYLFNSYQNLEGPDGKWGLGDANKEDDLFYRILLMYPPNHPDGWLYHVASAARLDDGSLVAFDAISAPRRDFELSTVDQWAEAFATPHEDNTQKYKVVKVDCMSFGKTPKANEVHLAICPGNTDTKARPPHLNEMENYIYNVSSGSKTPTNVVSDIGLFRSMQYFRSVGRNPSGTCGCKSGLRFVPEAGKSCSDYNGQVVPACKYSVPVVEGIYKSSDDSCEMSVSVEKDSSGFMHAIHTNGTCGNRKFMCADTHCDFNDIVLSDFNGISFSEINHVSDKMKDAKYRFFLLKTAESESDTIVEPPKTYHSSSESVTVKKVFYKNYLNYAFVTKDGIDELFQCFNNECFSSTNKMLYDYSSATVGYYNGSRLHYYTIR